MFLTIIRRWFPLAITITLLSFMVYVTGQMQYRAAADDPQEYMASDAAAKITAGAKPEAVSSAMAIDIAKNEGVFMVVYDKTGKAIAGSVTLDGTAAAVPKGVIDYALEHRTHHVSWQPKTGVREAVVFQKVDAAGANPALVVAVGRSLHAAEYRIGRLGFGVGVGWGVTMLATLIALAVTSKRVSTKMQ